MGLNGSAMASGGGMPDFLFLEGGRGGGLRFWRAGEGGGMSTTTHKHTESAGSFFPPSPRGSGRSQIYYTFP